MNWFLSLKSGHLFFLIVGIPFLAQVILAEIFFGPHQDLAMGVSIHFRTMAIVMFVSYLLFLLWCRSVSIFFYKKTPSHMIGRFSRFNVMFALSLLYVSLFSLYIGVGIMDQAVSQVQWDILLLIGIHILGLSATIYYLYFVAQAIKTFELQRKLQFSDFSEEFFMLLFFPVGVWKIQPKISELVSKKSI